MDKSSCHINNEFITNDLRFWTHLSFFFWSSIIHASKLYPKWLKMNNYYRIISSTTDFESGPSRSVGCWRDLSLPGRRKAAAFVRNSCLMMVVERWVLGVVFVSKAWSSRPPLRGGRDSSRLVVLHLWAFILKLSLKRWVDWFRRASMSCTRTPICINGVGHHPRYTMLLYIIIVLVVLFFFTLFDNSRCLILLLQPWFL